MPSFQDALRGLVPSSTSSTENMLVDSMNSVFLNNKTAWVNEVVDGYTKYGTDPNTTIGKLAGTYKLNDEQVKRLVEETNVNIYLNKYASTKGQKIRRVEFELADASKIGVHMETVASTQAVYGEMEKSASDNSEIFNGFNNNSDNYDVNMWSYGREKVASDMLKKKLKDRISACKTAHVEELKELLSKVAFISNAVIHNERAKGSGQVLFNKIASEANFDEHTINAIISKTASHVDTLKELRRLPTNFEFTLSRPEKVASNFALGKHSLIKEAATEEDPNVEYLPDNVDYKALLKQAKDLQIGLGRKRESERKDG